MENEDEFESPYQSMIYAIRSPVTREKYLGRLAYFMTFVGITDGTIENRCNIFGQKCRSNSKWLTNNIIRYVHIHRQRVERREIAASTLSNYIKPVKLFCEQLEITLPWKRITRGIPRGRRYANDRVSADKEEDEYLEDISNDDFTLKTKKIQHSLMNYLEWFELCPDSRKVNQYAKISWNYNQDDEITKRIIIRLGTLLAYLRGIIPTWETHDSQGIDYAYTFASVEEPDRAIRQLTNLARGHALSQGRNYILIEDVSLIIKVVFSTASVERVRIFELLLNCGGKLTTSQITNILILHRIQLREQWLNSKP